MDHDAGSIWETHAGAELDLLLVAGGERLGFEFTRAHAARMTRSMRIAMDDLELTRLRVVYRGPRAYDLGEGVRAVPLRDVDRSPSSPRLAALVGPPQPTRPRRCRPTDPSSW